MNKKIKKAFSLVTLSTTLMSGFSIGKVCYGNPPEYVKLTEAEIKEIAYGEYAKRLDLTVDEVRNNIVRLIGVLAKHSDELATVAATRRIADEVIQDSAEKLKTNRFWVRLADTIVQNLADYRIALLSMFPVIHLDDLPLEIEIESKSEVLRVLFRRLNVGIDIRYLFENDLEHYANDMVMYYPIVDIAINADRENAARILGNILKTERLSELARIRINNLLREACLLLEFPLVDQNPAQN